MLTVSLAYSAGVTTERDLGPRLSTRLTYLLKRALVDLEDLHAEHLAPVGVSGRELAVLLLLDGRDPQSQQQAAVRLGVDRTTMVGLLDDLPSCADLVTANAQSNEHMVAVNDALGYTPRGAPIVWYQLKVS